MPITKKKASAIVTPTPATAKAVAKKATAKAVAPATAKAVAVPALPKAGNPAEAHALETLADFYKSAEVSKPNPVLYVYSTEKATFLRGFLKVAKVRAQEQGKKFKFITIKSPADPKSAGDPKKAVSGPKPPAPNLP